MRGNSRANFIAAILFLFVIFLPLIGQAFPSLNVEPVVNEKRTFWPKPVMSAENIAGYPTSLEAFFNDHFGYRKLLVKINNLVKLDIFDISGSDKVLAGKDGWLFYNCEGVADQYRGIKRFTAGELESIKDAVEAKNDWLASQGIAYIFVVAPNKHSIYPEYLPDGVSKVAQETELDQLVKYMKENSDVEVLDLRGPIINAKQNGLLYYRTNTHWTGLGAYIGYKEIMARVSALRPVKGVPVEGGVIYGTSRVKGGDLAQMLGLQDELMEVAPTVSPAVSGSAVVLSSAREMVTENRKESNPRAVVFRDSFCDALIPFMSEDFRYVKYIDGPWRETTPIADIIRECRPDIVIEEMVERSIAGFRGASIPGHSQTRTLKGEA